MKHQIFGGCNQNQPQQQPQQQQKNIWHKQTDKKKTNTLIESQNTERTAVAQQQQQLVKIN